MKEKVAGLIITTGRGREAKAFDPLKKLGKITVLKRIVLTYQRANISPIIVITGEQAEEVERDLSGYGVVFLRNEQYATSTMFDSAKIGFEYLDGKCDRVLFTKLDVPLLKTDTIYKILNQKGIAISPVYEGKTGHPLNLHKSLIPQLLNYHGEEGMRGFLHSLEEGRVWVEVKDSGIIKSTKELEEDDESIEQHSKQMLHPYVRISIEKETMFFNERARLLLQLIAETNSVRKACSQMAMSYSKAWNLLNEMEHQLGFTVVKRRHGGRDGGKTELSEDGKKFLSQYIQFEERLKQFADSEFKRLFPMI